MNEISMKHLLAAFAKYADAINDEFSRLLKAWPENLKEPIVFRVLAVMLTRQIHFVLQMVSTPGLWNGHTAPLVLRPMLETHLKISWILLDPIPRCHGLAKADLIGRLAKLKQLESRISETPDESFTETLETMLQVFDKELLIFDQERKAILIEAREMAQKTGGKSLALYRANQVQLSSAVHSTWYHIAKYNLNFDPNPLHRYQYVPMFADLGIDFSFALDACSFCDETLKSLTGSHDNLPLTPLKSLFTDLEKLGALKKNDHADSERGS